MNEFDLPNELAAIESELSFRLPGDPPRELRARVLDSIRHQRQPVSVLVGGPSQQSWWTFVIGMAAAVVVWANLSFSALDFSVSSKGEHASESIDRDAALLQELIPELTFNDARYQVMRLGAGLRSSRPRLHTTTLNMHAG